MVFGLMSTLLFDAETLGCVCVLVQQGLTVEYLLRVGVFFSVAYHDIEIVFFIL